jgi:hypothetical protein
MFHILLTSFSFFSKNKLACEITVLLTCVLSVPAFRISSLNSLTDIRIRSIEKIHLIGTRTRDLPACSIVPQPITLPRASLLLSRYIFIICYKKHKISVEEEREDLRNFERGPRKLKHCYGSYYFNKQILLAYSETTNNICWKLIDMN